MGTRRWTAGLAALLLASCTTTEQIDGGALAALGNREPASGPLVLEGLDGERIRLDPRSKIRLILRDGRQSDWVPARRLAVTKDGRVVDGRRQLRLDQVETVEVDNVDGVKTYFLTVGIVAVAAAAIALLVASQKGDGPKAVPATSARAAPRVVTGAPVPWFYNDPWIYPPAPGFVVPIGGGPPPGRQRRPALPPNEGPTRLFTESAVRRSAFAPMMQFEAGYGFDPRTGGGLSIGGGFAIQQMFEISGGLRLSDITGPQRFTLGYARVGGNFPFEASDEFGAPIALDVAFGGDGFAHLRVIWGFRWRFASQFEVALLPANPMLSLVDDELYLDFPTMLQVGYRF